MSIDRAEIINDLIKKGLISVKDSLKILGLEDALNWIPTSVEVFPGLYLLSWVGNMIILTTTTYSKIELMRFGVNDWAEVQYSGYFQGTSMKDVKFIVSDKMQSKLDHHKMMYNLSDEEIKALTEEMLKYGQKPEPDEQLDFFGSGIMPVSKGYVDQDQTQKICKEHKWKQYHGLKETSGPCGKSASQS